MYERMLNKQDEPTFGEMLAYSGESGGLWLELEGWLESELDAVKLIRFPYGKDYGWGVKYSRKSKLICDVFAENGAFTVFFQVSGDAVESVYDGLSDYAKEVWAGMYPCANGGWVHFRVLNAEHLANVEKILKAKMTVKRKPK